MKLQRVLIDIGHPAQVHQFKHIYAELCSKGYDVLFTTKDKDIALYLLNSYKIPYRNLGKPKKGLIKKILYIPASCFRFYQVVRFFKPDIVLSRFSFHASWVSFLLRKKHIGFTDTEHVGWADTLTVPFVKAKLTAFSYYKDLGKNHFRFSGNIELFYLHPNRFSPDRSILDFLGVKENEKYAIVRFVSWDAHHDVGESGLSLKQKQELVKKLGEQARIFISSEKEIPDEFKDKQINIPPEKMHDAMFYSSLYVGEGGTMASESAVLGTPSVYINSLNMGYIQEEIDAGLIFRYTDGDEAIRKSLELIKLDNKEVFCEISKDFLKQKIDVTAFTVWFVENYPHSVRIMKDNPDYQYRFK